MAFIRINQSFHPLSDDVLNAWKEIPPAVASDCMNRTQSLGAALKPITPGLTICGQARTAEVMVGDCASICELISTARPGEVIVVDAGGFEDTAVWGGIMATEATHRCIGGAVVYGAIRDVAEIRQLGFAMFCKSIVPKGPHHGFGGVIDGSIAINGATIRPGDLVLGNDDGVVVIPLERTSEILAAAQAHLKKEAIYIDGIRNGHTIMDMYQMTPSKVLEPHSL
ncbi:RraA family protein [Brucella haematophila]|uniref:RraA family protein n=1 Tax=Brucella haematophila TaxID=419474 RepID=UPI000DE2B968|nr:RraA family protein [Brucella haematophila]TMV04370.1 RraA family protein [Brucella haematophila]